MEKGVKRNFKLMVKSSLAIKFISIILSFLNTIVINRLLGVELRGEYTFILNVSNMIHLLLNFGVGYSYSYFIKEKYEKSREIFTKIIYYQFLLYFIAFFFLSIIVNNQYNKIIILFSIIMTLNLQLLFITMVEDIIKRNKILLYSSMLYSMSLIIIFYLFKVRNIYVVLLITCLKYIIEIILLVQNFGLYIKRNNKVKVDKKILKKILKIGTPTVIMTILISLNYNLDVIILKYLSSNYEVGLYGVAVTLANMVWIIPDAFKEVILSKSSQEDCIKEIVISIIINIVICVFIVLGFCLLGKVFINVVYGEEYINSYYIIILLFIGTIPMIVYKLIHPLYLSNGEQNLVMKILLISVISNIILNFITIPNYGAIGAAISSVVSYSICGVIFWINFKKKYKVGVKLMIKNLIIRKK